MINFNTYEEAAEMAKSTNPDNREQVQAIISGEYTIGEPTEELTAEVVVAPEETDTVVIDPTVATEPVIEPVVEPVIEPIIEPVVEVVEPAVDNRTAQEIASELYDAEKEKLQALHDAELDALRKQIATKEPTKETKEEHTESSDMLELQKLLDNDDDSDMASSYEKGTRDLLKRIAAQLSNGDTQLKERLGEIDKAKELILKQKEDELAQAKFQREMDEVYTDIDHLVKSKTELNLPVSTREAHETAMRMRTSISKLYGVSDDGQIEKLYRVAVRGESVRGKEIRQKMKASGLEVPEYMNTFVAVTDLDDLRRGCQFNEVSSQYEETALSLDDIYKLKNYPKLVNAEVHKEVASVADIINNRSNSATSLLDVNVIETEQPGTMTVDEARAVLGLSIQTLRKDPALAKKYAEACALAKSPVPESVKLILK